MRFLNLLIVFSCSYLHISAFAADNSIVGAGSSLASAIVQDWSKAFAAQSQNPLQVTYLPSSSGEGIRSITTRSVDFGVSDIPLTAADLSHDDLIQFPLSISAVVPIYHLPAAGDRPLKLSASVLADIYLGKITYWDDQEIIANNPSIHLPHTAIVPFHRADNSGTSYTFTYYLAKNSETWSRTAGIGSRLNWPIKGAGVKSGSGMKQSVQETIGSIGYLEYGQAVSANISRITLKNSSGEFVEANLDSIKAASQRLEWARNSFYEILVDVRGKDCWPILAVSYGLIHKTSGAQSKTKSTIEFMHWIYHHGQVIAQQNNLLPLENQKLIQQIETVWSELRDESGKQLWVSHD